MITLKAKDNVHSYVLNGWFSKLGYLLADILLSGYVTSLVQPRLSGQANKQPKLFTLSSTDNLTESNNEISVGIQPGQRPLGIQWE